MNRTIAGDIVVVELLDKAQWKQESTLIVEDGSSQLLFCSS